MVDKQTSAIIFARSLGRFPSGTIRSNWNDAEKISMASLHALWFCLHLLARSARRGGMSETPGATRSCV